MKKMLVLVLLFVGFAQANNIGISPPRLELSGEPGETITEIVTILGNESIDQQIQVRLGDWTLKPDGELVFLPAESLSESASAWITPELEEFALTGEANRQFRISITIPEDASTAGTFHSMVFFRVVPPPNENEGLAVVTTTEIGVGIYVTVVGTEDNASELLDFYQGDDRSLTLSIVNDGNTVMRLGGAVELRDEEGVTQYTIELPNVPILRESERDLIMDLPEEVKAGFYVALALIEDSRGGLLVGELALDIP